MGLYVRNAHSSGTLTAGNDGVLVESTPLTLVVVTEVECLLDMTHEECMEVETTERPVRSCDTKRDNPVGKC